MVMVRIEGLVKRFGSLTAVDGVSLEIAAGEVFGLLGPNGAGKSTTINTIMGLLTPDEGSVALPGGGSPRDPEARRSVGLAPQTLSLYADLTGRENLELFATLHGVRGPAHRQRVAALLEFVDLADRAGDRVKAYSGGMKRRLNLAAAIVHDPPVVLLDEPTAGVDPQSRNRLFELVEDLRGQGKAVVYTTHYMEEAQRLCDRVAIIDRGRVLALDTVDGLIRAHGGASVVVVERAGAEERIETSDPLAEVREILARGDATGLRIDRAGLEAVFLSLTGRSMRDGVGVSPSEPVAGAARDGGGA